MVNTQFQFPGAPRGFNGLFSVVDYGARFVRINRISYGIEIRTSTSDESASRRAFYPILMDKPDFMVEVVHTSWEERERFNKWMSAYFDRVVAGTVAHGYMLVRCPVRRFARIAVPRGPLTYGDNKEDVDYRTPISFVASEDPLDLRGGNKVAGASYAEPLDPDSIANYFYPTGRQVRGAESLEGTIFDPGGSGGFPEPPHIHQPGEDPGAL